MPVSLCGNLSVARVLCRWFKRMAIAVAAPALLWGGEPAEDAKAKTIDLTAEEKAWIAAHPTIRVGFDGAWPPFSATEKDGSCVGIDADLLKLIGERLGVAFTFVTADSWPAIYTAAQGGEVDMLAGTAQTVERAEQFSFTEPYFSFPVVIVTRNDEPILWSMIDLAGRRVVGVRGYVATTEITRQYPTIQVTVAESVREAMAMVSHGKADAFITNLPNASFVAKTEGLTNLKISGVVPDRFDLRYAVRRDWPELAALLNRAIAALDEADRQAIVHPWIRVDYAKVIRWDVVWKTSLAVLGILGLVIGAIGYHNRRLKRELVERIRLQNEIKEAHDQLLQLNEEKTELLQMAAHDLRGPLTSMQLVVDSSLRLGAIPSARALEMVEKQIRQMTSLLNDLLDAEALEHGRRDFKIEPVDPAATLRAALVAAEPAANHKSIRLDLMGIDEGVAHVGADATALRQIIDNLISNALKFSPRESTVKIALVQRNQQVRLEVHDQGPGVAAEETERIFGKYARGSARPTGGEKSTGLGLAIVRQLATGMNGRVWCESRPGGGLFVLVLPVEPPAPTPAS